MIFFFFNIYTQTWKDEFLTWDPSKYENVESMNTESTKIWLPNIMSYDM